MATTTPETPAGVPVIVPPYEGQQQPTPVAAQTSWTAAMAKVTPQGGLL